MALAIQLNKKSAGVLESLSAGSFDLELMPPTQNGNTLSCSNGKLGLWYIKNNHNFKPESRQTLSISAGDILEMFKRLLDAASNSGLHCL